MNNRMPHEVYERLRQRVAVATGAEKSRLKKKLEAMKSGIEELKFPISRIGARVRKFAITVATGGGAGMAAKGAKKILNRPKFKNLEKE